MHKNSLNEDNSVRYIEYRIFPLDKYVYVNNIIDSIPTAPLPCTRNPVGFLFSGGKVEI